MAKKFTEIEILLACKKGLGLATDSAFADALGISRQKLYNWLNGINKPSTDVLKLWALVLLPVTKWKAHLAIDLLKTRGMSAEIPCTCDRNGNGEITIKNPICPKHFEEKELEPVH
jgi:Helix-turn-helix.